MNTNNQTKINIVSTTRINQSGLFLRILSKQAITSEDISTNVIVLSVCFYSFVISLTGRIRQTTQPCKCLNKNASADPQLSGLSRTLLQFSASVENTVYETRQVHNRNLYETDIFFGTQSQPGGAVEHKQRNWSSRTAFPAQLAGRAEPTHTGTSSNNSTTVYSKSMWKKARFFAHTAKEATDRKGRAELARN